MPPTPREHHAFRSSKGRLARGPSLLLIGLVLISCGLGDKVKDIQNIAESVEDAASKLEAGDTTGAEEVFGKLLGGGESVEAIDFRTLKELLPEALPGFERTDASGEKSKMMGIGTSKAEGRYQTADQQGSIDITIMDLGSVRGLGMFGINWLMVEVDKESDQGYERTVKYEGYPAFEKFEQGSDWSRGEMSLFVADRFIVTVKGQNVDDDELRDIRQRIDLDRLEGLRNEGVKPPS